MEKAINNFKANILRVRNLGGLYKALLSLTTRVIDPSDLLRAQIVLGVSALDHYVHEVTLLGMLEVFEGRRATTSAFLKFQVSMDFVLSGSMSGKNSTWFEEEIRERHSFLSFHRPDKIADAIRLFSDVQLWKEVGMKLSTPERHVKEQINMIIDRRNKIAHEADTDPSYPGARWPINEADVTRSLETIEKICEALHWAVTK